MSDEKTEAIQNVVDRVGAYQSGAPEGTVEKELREGLSEAGLELDESTITTLADAIENADGDVDVATVLS